MNLQDISDFIRQNGGTQIPLLQLKFGLSYAEAKAIVDWLVEDGKLFYLSGVDYTCDRAACGVEQPVAFDEEEDDFELFSDDELDEDYDDDDEEEDEEDERFAEYERFLREQLDVDEEEENDNDEVDDQADEDGEDDDFDSVFKRYMERHEKLIEQFKVSAQELVDVLCAIRDKKSAPITAFEAPDRSLWKDEDAFVEAVRERVERLVKSDGQMDLQGAIKKAELWLDAVRDTHDRMMVQVYEWLVYEIKSHDRFSYGLLKKRYCGQ